MHSEAVGWLERAHFEPFLSWPILGANLRYLTRHPSNYWTTLLTLLRRTWGSAWFFVGGLVFFPRAVCFAQQIMVTGVDHVHAHFANHPAAIAEVIHRLTEIPYSFTAHGSDLHRERRMRKEKVAEAAFVVAISDYNRQMILEECGPSASAKPRWLLSTVESTRRSSNLVQLGRRAQAMRSRLGSSVSGPFTR